MTRAYLADAKPEERSALRLLLLDLKMKVVGEAVETDRVAIEQTQQNMIETMNQMREEKLKGQASTPLK